METEFSAICFYNVTLSTGDEPSYLASYLNSLLSTICVKKTSCLDTVESRLFEIVGTILTSPIHLRPNSHGMSTESNTDVILVQKMSLTNREFE